MGAKKIRRDVVKHELRTMELLKGKIATVSIAQDTTTGAILSVGADHASAFANVPVGRVGWEIREHRLWR